jgi:hypothetical protein
MQATLSKTSPKRSNSRRAKPSKPRGGGAEDETLSEETPRYQPRRKRGPASFAKVCAACEWAPERDPFGARAKYPVEKDGRDPASISSEEARAPAM